MKQRPAGAHGGQAGGLVRALGDEHKPITLQGRGSAIFTLSGANCEPMQEVPPAPDGKKAKRGIDCSLPAASRSG